ncbi:MAG: Mrp/NBP35 family ATP-binding protein [Anaerolineae bacterium]
MTTAPQPPSESASQSAPKASDINRIDHVVAVLSGKGGVGKSIVSSLLAVSLRRKGHRVGILDADITGPSIPKMFLSQAIQLGSDPLGIPPAVSRTGIKLMSINLLLRNESDAVIWRGPLIGRAIQQFWADVVWGELDYLIVDLPPGTSDASLTVMQFLPLSGALLVTAPQGLAGMVVHKAAQMAEMLHVPLLGLVENMSYFVCPDNGKAYEVFGPSHAEELAHTLGIPFLGRLPIKPELTLLSDTGRIEEYPAEEFAPIVAHIEAAAQAPRLPPFSIDLGGL